MSLTLRKARSIIKAALAHGRAENLKPLTVVVLDNGGHVIAVEREDGASAGRFDIARGKAYGCVMLGMGGAAIAARGEGAGALFVQSLGSVYDGKIVPVRGGILLKDAKGAVQGAVGITGDTSDNDAAAALAGAAAAGLTGEG